jgi:hypothetical protein
MSYSYSQKQIDKSNKLIGMKDVYIDISHDGDEIVISYKNIHTRSESPTTPHGYLRILPYQKWRKLFYEDPADYNDVYGEYIEFEYGDPGYEIDLKRKEKYEKYGYLPPCKAKNREIYCVFDMKASNGWGPLLFEVGLEWCTLNNTYLINDRRDVSPESITMMEIFQTRSDIEKVQLDDLDNTLTDIDEDNCWQYYYDDVNGLRNDSRSKAYRKVSPLNLILNLYLNNRIDIRTGNHNQNYRLDWNKIHKEIDVW